jgi:hypothetical protein
MTESLSSYTKSNDTHGDSLPIRSLVRLVACTGISTQIMLTHNSLYSADWHMK